tara:strand:- start:3730 stop:4236 length:507 start_codon:yes stop_codon:yes gene_type:complete
MAKGDYKNSDVKGRYRNLAKARTDLKEESEKIVVSNDDKRTRAELLDIVEELFEPNTGQTVEKLRAVLYMIINSLGNNSDDDPGITTEQSNAITANTAKTTFPGLGTSSTTALAGNTTTISANQQKVLGVSSSNVTIEFSLGARTLDVAVVDTSSGSAVTKNGSISLR